MGSHFIDVNWVIFQRQVENSGGKAQGAKMRQHARSAEQDSPSSRQGHGTLIGLQNRLQKTRCNFSCTAGQNVTAEPQRRCEFNCANADVQPHRNGALFRAPSCNLYEFSPIEALKSNLSKYWSRPDQPYVLLST